MLLLCLICITAQAEPQQKFCPLMVEDPIDADEFVTYKGVKVYTCCGSCKVLWRQNPDYFAVVARAQAPQLAAVAPKDIKPLAQLFCPVYTDRRVHPKSLALVHNGRTIYFSRERARERFQENPDKFLQQLK